MQAGFLDSKELFQCLALCHQSSVSIEIVEVIRNDPISQEFNDKSDPFKRT